MFTRKLIIVQLFLLMIPFFAFSQIPKEDFKKDLERYKLLLKRYYLGYDYYIDSKTLDSKLSEMYGALPDTLSLNQTYDELAKINTLFQDLHLSVSYPSSYKVERYFPLEIRKFGPQFYVAYNLSMDTLIHRGDRIVSIEGKDPNYFYDQFKQRIASDGDTEFSKSYYAEYSFRSFLTHIYRDSILVNFQRDSVTFQRSLVFETQNKSKKILEERYPNALRKNVKLNTQDSISVLDITSFSGRLKKPLDKAFKKVSNANDLIIDLRGNGGGAIKNMTHLLRYVLNDPFKLYDTVKINKASLQKVTKSVAFVPVKWLLKKDSLGDFYKVKWRTYKPYTRNHFDGNLYVLVNGGTYSASSFAVALLNNQKRATFIGSPPGGANWGSFAGIFKSFTLKYSKLRVNIPLMQLQYNSEGQSHSNFVVLPDFYVNQDFEEFLKREDSVLKFTRNLILKAHERD